MFSMLRRIFQRDNEIHTETRTRQEDAGLRPRWQVGRMRLSWGRHSESWAKVGKLPGGGGLDLVIPEIRLMISILNMPQWQTQSQEFLIISFPES